jgi:hypothetical protein
MVDSVISEAVNLCLENWTALKLAVDMGWGEEEDKSNLIQSLTDYILQFEVNSSDVSNFLEDAMESKFSVVLEDNSAEDIANILLKVYQEHMKGQNEEISKLRRLQSADTETCTKVKPPPDLVQAVQDLQVDPPVLVDEDGFELVVSKKKKNK